jgi:uncharacterized cupredoxin-like copper-binding protein
MTKLRVLMFGLVSAAMLAWAVPAMAHPARAAGTTVKVTAGKPSEFHFTLSAMSVKHGAVTFTVTNKGALGHDFKICSSAKGGLHLSCAGSATPLIAPGKTATLKVTFKTAGTYEYLCVVPGHAAAGMKGDIKVT